MKPKVDRDGDWSTRRQLLRVAGMGLVGWAVGAGPEPAPGADGDETREGKLPGRIFVRIFARQGDAIGGLIAVDPNMATWESIVDDSFLNERVSPDGRLVAYFRRDEQNRVALFVRDVAGAREPVRLLEAGFTWPCWLPDSCQLIVSTLEEPQEALRFKTWRIKADGSGREVLPVADTEWARDISPDGQWLVTYSTRNQPRLEPGQRPPLQLGDVYLIRTDGRGERLLIPKPKAPAGDAAPSISLLRFSPDGRSVACVEMVIDRDRTEHAPRVLWEVDIETRARRKVFQGDIKTMRIGSACCSPDGKWLAVSLFEPNPEPGQGAVRTWIELIEAESGRRRPIPLPPVSYLGVIDWR